MAGVAALIRFVGRPWTMMNVVTSLEGSKALTYRSAMGIRLSCRSESDVRQRLASRRRPGSKGPRLSQACLPPAPHQAPRRRPKTPLLPFLHTRQSIKRIAECTASVPRRATSCAVASSLTNVDEGTRA